MTIEATSVYGLAAVPPKPNLYMGQRPDKPILTPEELADAYPHIHAAYEEHGVMEADGRRTFYVDVGEMTQAAQRRHLQHIMALHVEGRAIEYADRGVTFLRAA